MFLVSFLENCTEKQIRATILVLSNSQFVSFLILLTPLLYLKNHTMPDMYLLSFTRVCTCKLQHPVMLTSSDKTAQFRVMTTSKKRLVISR